MERRKIKLTFSYQGTAYYGFQRQRNGPSVQKTMEDALRKILKQETTLHASGRTDSGVHARQQVAHFCTAARMPADRIPVAINTILPDDIVVLEAVDMPADFHARYYVTEKTYKYRLLNQRPADPFLREWAQHVKIPLNLEKMRRAAAYLVGTHDFTSFCSTRAVVEDKVRTIHEIRIEESKRDDSLPGQGFDIWLTFRGSGFLYNMVRIMTGTLVEVGKGKWEAEDVRRMLEARNRDIAGITAPAHGLYLWEVKY
ncbi:tRNA pseudouridine synthase A [Aneurinibacillus tyrosinisolvens]|uniref:tRNA pseudouridine synthase A n=1 Tax=Aneurinibacillus tyrosinisolvens TaxID=1443435 RepID=A0A0E9NT19_9BACL|nr:tRNA pseudouridine(38-40) synthase TruA [Aneurinibacillus tyrosinisolvens]GAO52873.1 tRNA pseudouridine synthase A [Aneurinibacillus tyrosinisolvens]